MERRTLLFTGAAFLVGLLLAVSLFADGPLGGGGAAPITVRVENAGSRAATALLEVDALDEGYSTRSEVPLGPRATRAIDLARELSGDVFLKVTVSWTEGGRSARGDQALILQPGDCGGGERAFVVFHVDTTNGVAFGSPARGCE